jgi:L-rhamnose isomerase
MATIKAKTIKLNDLASAIESAVQASAGKKFPGGIIMGKVAPKEQFAKLDANAVARQITKQVQAVTDVKLTPKVILDGGVITMGFIFRPPVEINR